MPSRFPRRIICLTEETTETLYLLGQQERIVGISAYTKRPAEARTKPRVSAFINANFDKIVELRPELVLAFSDLQADIARELIARGLNVCCFNQRSVEEILDMMLTLARLTGVEQRGLRLVARMRAGLDAIAASARRFPARPRVFFEEWNDPLISGIRWVEELVELAGGQPVFPELCNSAAAKDRIVEPARVIERDPQVIFASWCGAKVKKDVIRARPGWQDISAVRDGHIYEINSTVILQPGPAALTEGVRQIHALLAHTAGMRVPARLAPREPLDVLTPRSSARPAPRRGK